MYQRRTRVCRCQIAYLQRKTHRLAGLHFVDVIMKRFQHHIVYEKEIKLLVILWCIQCEFGFRLLVDSTPQIKCVSVLFFSSDAILNMVNNIAANVLGGKPEMEGGAEIGGTPC